MDESSRNDVSGTVNGPVVQAGAINGDVHIHSSDDQRLLRAHEEVGRVRRQLAESVAAERDLTRVVWVLQVVLAQARETVARLTRDRDHLLGEAERRHAELARAREARARTERQLRRAEEEREQALRLVEVAREKARALEAQLRGQPPAQPSPALEPAALAAGLDNVDAYLDRQGERLERLSAALGAASPRAAPPRAAPSGAAPGPATGSPPPRVLFPLVAALLRMPGLADTSSRNTVIRLLGYELGTPLAVPESAHPTVHLSNLVLACLERTDGLRALLRVLRHIEHDSIPVREAQRVVDELAGGLP